MTYATTATSSAATRESEFEGHSPFAFCLPFFLPSAFCLRSCSPILPSDVGPPQDRPHRRCAGRDARPLLPSASSRLSRSARRIGGSRLEPDESRGRRPARRRHGAARRQRARHAADRSRELSAGRGDHGVGGARRRRRGERRQARRLSLPHEGGRSRRAALDRRPGGGTPGSEPLGAHAARRGRGRPGQGVRRRVRARRSRTCCRRSTRSPGCRRRS